MKISLILDQTDLAEIAEAGKIGTHVEIEASQEDEVIGEASIAIKPLRIRVFSSEDVTKEVTEDLS